MPSCNSNSPEKCMNKSDPIPARLAALKTTPTPDLKQQWRDLFDSEPPPFNRRYLESRLAYRIQELAYGGLKPETIRRHERLGEELDGGDRKKSWIRADTMPIAGTRLIREWQGVEHVVTVTTDGFEWQGGPTSDFHQGCGEGRQTFAATRSTRRDRRRHPVAGQD